jgi:uncharacterized protein
MLFLFLIFTNFLWAHTYTAQIHLQNEIVTVELARSPEEQARGLMHRVSLNENSGMLFIYDKPRILAFWMKNTLVPLDVGFFDQDRRLTQIEHMDVPEDGNIPVYQSRQIALYALEVPQGWFERHHIYPSTRLEW